MKLRIFALIVPVSLCFAACNENLQFTDLVRSGEYSVQLEVPPTLKTGEESLLTLHTFKAKKPVFVEDELRMLHIVIASSDLQDLAHIIYPDQKGKKGTYSVPYEFLSPGTYRLWVEIESLEKEESHGTGADLIAYTEFSVEGETKEASIPLSTNGEATVDGYVLRVAPHVLPAGKDALLRFSVRRSDSTVIVIPPHEILYGLTKNDFSFFSHGHTYTAPDGKSATLSVKLPDQGEYGLVVQVYFLDGDFPKMIEGHFRLIAAK